MQIPCTKKRELLIRRLRGPSLYYLGRLENTQTSTSWAGVFSIFSPQFKVPWPKFSKDILTMQYRGGKFLFEVFHSMRKRVISVVTFNLLVVSVLERTKCLRNLDLFFL